MSNLQEGTVVLLDLHNETNPQWLETETQGEEEEVTLLQERVMVILDLPDLL